MRALIIGAGEIGTAIGSAIKVAGHEVLFWDRNATKCTPNTDLRDMLGVADCIFFCVPSGGLREAGMLIYEELDFGKLLVTLAKGMEPGSHKTSREVLKDIFPSNPVVVLGGPMIAEEILKGEVAIGVLGYDDSASEEKVALLFKSTQIFIEKTEDAVGLAICGVLKNIYSLSFGFAESMGEGSNIKGFLAAECLKEMVGIVTQLGGRAETAMGPGGLGDLVASGMSVYGYNRRVGKELLDNGKAELGSEGILSIGSVIALLGDHASNYKLLSVIQKIIFNPKEGKKIFLDYIRG